jgi:hypothetical protein
MGILRIVDILGEFAICTQPCPGCGVRGIVGDIVMQSNDESRRVSSLIAILWDQYVAFDGDITVIFSKGVKRDCLKYNLKEPE